MIFTDYKKYGNEINAHDVIKCVAIILMVIDHVGKYFYPDINEFRLIGRMAFPLFMFLIGWSLQYDFRKSLLFFALALTAVDIVTHQAILPLNILYAILLTRVVIGWLHKGSYVKTHLFVIFALLFVWWLPLRLLVDYSTTAIMFAICGYLVRKKARDKKVISFFVLTAVFHIATQSLFFNFSPIQVAIMISAIAIIVWGMFHYEFEKFTSYKKNSALIIPMFLARNSLQLYFLHLAVIKIVLYLLYPELYESFRLI